MIIQTDNYDFNPEGISAVDRDYQPGVETVVIYVYLHGAGMRLSGEEAQSFLYQWDQYKVLHNECQAAAGL